MEEEKLQILSANNINKNKPFSKMLKGWDRQAPRIGTHMG